MRSPLFTAVMNLPAVAESQTHILDCNLLRHREMSASHLSCTFGIQRLN